MIRSLYDSAPKKRVVVLVDAATLRKAEKFVESCEACNPDGAEIPFDNLLDLVTASDLGVAYYIPGVPAKCPNCLRNVLQKTRIEHI